jgi:hypothetical protein
VAMVEPERPSFPSSTTVQPESPSFLASPPIMQPDPRTVRVVVPVAANPFRVAGEIRQSPAKPPIAEPRRRAPQPTPIAASGSPVGDHAGEHVEMTHGKYHAWFYVAAAFILEVLILAMAPTFALTEMLPLGDIGWGLGLAVGIAGSLWVFHDRWRCIEAFASRFCSGLANLSVLYVPFVALIYANARGLAKLRR